MSQIGGLGTFIHEVGVCPSTCAISRYLWNVCLIDSWRIILILVVYMICYLWVAYTWALVNYLLEADECVIIGRKAMVIMACGCSNDDDTEWLWKWALHTFLEILWLVTADCFFLSLCHWFPAGSGPSFLFSLLFANVFLWLFSVIIIASATGFSFIMLVISRVYVTCLVCQKGVE